MFSSLQKYTRSFLLLPPKITLDYSKSDYLRFMQDETFLFSPKYAKKRVKIYNGQYLIDSIEKGGAVLASLHYGSHFLVGPAINALLNLSCTAIVTHANLEILPEAEANFWRGVHRRTSVAQGIPLFSAGIAPKSEIIKYLRFPKRLIWAMLDVREAGRPRPEFQFEFQNQMFYFQIGAAKLSATANCPFIPICIQYQPEQKIHHLYIGDAILPSDDPVDMTQTALKQIENMIRNQNNQFFHDLAFFERPLLQNR